MPHQGKIHAKHQNRLSSLVEIELAQLKIAPAEDSARHLSELPGCRLSYPVPLITSEAEAEQACEKLQAQPPDLIVLHFVTFPAGALIPLIAARTQPPIVLLANPEEPGENRIWEQNSFCGANLGAFVMRRMDKHYAFVRTMPEHIGSAIQKHIAAARCIKTLRNCRVGLLGGRVPGFYTSNIDEMMLRRKFGSAVELCTLLEMSDLAEKLTPEQLRQGRNLVKKSAARVNGVSERELELLAKMYAAILLMVEKYRLDALALRCWPENPDIFGIAPCAAIGLLNDLGLPVSCEGDVPGALSMKILQALANGGIPLFVDLISYDEKENTAVAWHCGAAPCSLSRNFDETEYNLHFRVDGGNKKGVCNEFSLKQGKVTIAKLDQDKDGHFRMLLASGTALDTEPFIRGNPLNIRLHQPVNKLIDLIMKKGLEHHYTLIYGDVKEELLQFCEWMDIELLMPE